MDTGVAVGDQHDLGAWLWSTFTWLGIPGWLLVAYFFLLQVADLLDNIRTVHRWGTTVIRWLPGFVRGGVIPWLSAVNPTIWRIVNWGALAVGVFLIISAGLFSVRHGHGIDAASTTNQSRTPIAERTQRIPWSQGTFKISRAAGGTLKHCAQDQCVEFIVDPVVTVPAVPAINVEEGPGLNMRLENANFPSFTRQSGIDAIHVGYIRLVPGARGFIHTVEVDIEMVVERVEFESVYIRVEFLNGSHVREWDSSHTSYSMLSMGVVDPRAQACDPLACDPRNLKFGIEEK